MLYFVYNRVFKNIINIIFYFDDNNSLNNRTQLFKIRRNIENMNSNNLNPKTKKVFNINLKTNLFKVKNKSIILILVLI